MTAPVFLHYILYAFLRFFCFSFFVGNDCLVNQTDDESGYEERNPVHTEGMERQSLEDGINRSQRNLSCLQARYESRYKSEDCRADPYTAATAKQIVGKGKNNVGNDQRIYEHQDRDSGDDDGLQAGSCNCKGCNGKNGNVILIARLADELMEVRCTRRNQTD